MSNKGQFQRIDITGERYGLLVALRFSKRENKRSFWLFRCDCGNEKEASLGSVRRGSTESCGCKQVESARKSLSVNRHCRKFLGLDITNERFGRLVAVKRTGKTRNQSNLWECICDCGKKKITTTHLLKTGKTRSCGCRTYLKGSDHPTWKGRTRIKNGYVSIWDDEEGKHVLEHRVVMRKIIGRKLLPNENVHHINGIRSDNRPENLELWTSSQPPGQRIKDLVAFANEILDRYGHLV